ncbi:hypothetical protein ACFP3V_31790, partial [Streptacidiphilus monticola]
MTSWDEAVGELFALPPAQFVKARDARAAEARRAGDRELAERLRALHRPTVAAAVLDLLAGHRSEEVDRLLELGQELREAQASWSGPRLRELAGQRARLVAERLAEAVRGDERA